MVEIRPFLANQDFSDLVKLHCAQDSHIADMLSIDTLPAIGFVADQTEFDAAEYPGPVAMGFLRMVEGGYAQIDTLVSNPAYPGLTRHVAISALVNQLISTAKSMNLKGIISYTVDKSTIERAEAIGFQLMPSQVISLKL